VVLQRAMRPRILLVDGIGRAACYTELRAALDADWLLELTPAVERDAVSNIDLAIVSQENHSPTSISLCRLVERGIPTLCLMDGITEWRFTWTYHEPEPGQLSRPRYQPVLAHKVACIGRSQARLFESWGSLGKCEVVGLPRLDPLRERPPRRRQPGEPLRLLITTAKMPAFSTGQLRDVVRSLQDLKRWLDGARADGRLAVEPVWRLTFELEAQLGVRNELSDDTGSELARVLSGVDAMVTTPSTCMVEGMLQSIPVALLDYHGCPSYVPAAWSIGAPEHLDRVLPELASPPLARMLYQDTVLHDALECRTAALPRLLRLIEGMIDVGQECRRSGRPLAFPCRMLPDEQGGHHLPEERFDLGTLYPDHVALAAMDRAALQAELAHLRFQHAQDVGEATALRARLAMRDPMRWLRAVSGAVRPRRLWTALTGRRRTPPSRQAPAWARSPELTASRRAPSERGEGDA
jgi:hypothetical protein